LISDPESLIEEDGARVCDGSAPFPSAATQPVGIIAEPDDQAPTQGAPRPHGNQICDPSGYLREHGFASAREIADAKTVEGLFRACGFSRSLSRALAATFRTAAGTPDDQDDASDKTETLALLASLAAKFRGADQE